MSGNTYGRQVQAALTNKSGGGVVAGDVVIVDTANNDAFTTTTSAATTQTVGIAQETIASNATGRVLLQGYASLVNVNASVTRGHYGATHTVAKQAADAGASRAAGTFCQFLTGGTTPDALVWPVDLGGASVNVTTKGDVQGYSTTPARVPVGSDNYALVGDSSASLGVSYKQAILASFAPELLDNGGTTAIDMSGAATGTSVTANALTGCAGRIVFADNSTQYWDVASAVGTGDFDYRCRIISYGADVAANGSGNNPIFYFGVTDSARTTTTSLWVRITGMGNNAGTLLQAQAYTGTATAITGLQSALHLPLILRVKRTGTTVDRMISMDNGLTWDFLGSSTSSLNVAKVGLWGTPNNATVVAHQIAVHWVRAA